MKLELTENQKIMFQICLANEINKYIDRRFKESKKPFSLEISAYNKEINVQINNPVLNKAGTKLGYSEAFSKAIKQAIENWANINAGKIKLKSLN